MKDAEDKIPVTKTARGFELGTIHDTYGVEGTVQQSSAASESCLWLGVSDPTIDRFTPGDGQVPGRWETVDLNQVVPVAPGGSLLIHSRLHLNRRQVRELSRVLNRWLRTGSLSEE